MRRRWKLAVAAAVAALAALTAWAWTPDIPRAELQARWQRGPLIEVAGTRLHVQDSGPRDAPALLLVHGFGASLHTWDRWAAALERDFRIVRLDLPGSGLSPPDSTGDYGDARSVALLAALLDRLALPRVALVGHSIGGRIVWAFAAQHPGRVDRLVLVAPDGFASEGFAYGRPPAISPLIGAMRWTLPWHLVRWSLEPAYGDPSLVSDELVTRYQQLMRAPGTRGAMIDRLRQTVLQDPVPQLQRIGVPVLLVWGEADQAIPIANADDYLRALPQATLLRLPGIGHLPQEEHPERSLPALREFLQRPLPAATAPGAATTAAPG